MSNGRIVTCDCGTQFIFRDHITSGRRGPINVKEDPNGNIAILDDGRYRIILAGEDYDGPRYLNHFSDCTLAGNRRRKLVPGQTVGPDTKVDADGYRID